MRKPYKRVRVLRRITRKPDSRYKVDLSKVPIGECVLLNIYDEKDLTVQIATFEFIATKPYLHFMATEVEGRWQIKFTSILDVRKSTIDHEKCLWIQTN